MKLFYRRLYIAAELQCWVMLLCLLIGSFGICPDDCYENMHDGKCSFQPIHESESHHFCTMLACSHCSSFIAADPKNLHPPEALEMPLCLTEKMLFGIFADSFFHPPIPSFPG